MPKGKEEVGGCRELDGGAFEALLGGTGIEE